MLKDTTSNSNWILCFQDYLKQRKLINSIHLFDFVQDCQSLLAIQSEISSNNNLDWKCYQDSCAKRKELIVQIFRKYFDEESSLTAIPLSNQLLREEIYQQLKDISMEDTYEAKEDANHKAIDLLKNASRDYRVWKGGLEIVYKEFLATKPSNKVSTHLTAVLLSIM